MLKKKKRMEELDRQMRKFAKVENELSKSLASSRNVTPVPTPLKQKVSRVKSSAKKTVDKKKRVVSTKAKLGDSEERSRA